MGPAPFGRSPPKVCLQTNGVKEKAVPVVVDKKPVERKMRCYTGTLKPLESHPGAIGTRPSEGKRVREQSRVFLEN